MNIDLNHKNNIRVSSASDFLSLIKNKDNLLFKEICGEIQRNHLMNHYSHKVLRQGVRKMWEVQKVAKCKQRNIAKSAQMCQR